MFKGLFDRQELLIRIKYIYACAVTATVVVVGYLVFAGVSQFTEVIRAEGATRVGKAESVKLAAKAKYATSQKAGFPATGSTGVEAFAVQMATCARTHKLSVESITPEGAEGTVAANFNEIPLGEWATNQVKVRGRGGFSQVMEALDDLCSKPSPFRLQSFSLQAADSGVTGSVEFEIMVTVYRRKSENA